MEKDVGDELPQKEFFPDEKRHKTKIFRDPITHDTLQKKENGHEDDQFLDHGSQAIAKRESVTIIGHSALHGVHRSWQRGNRHDIIVALLTGFFNVSEMTLCFKSFCFGSAAQERNGVQA